MEGKKWERHKREPRMVRFFDARRGTYGAGNGKLKAALKEARQIRRRLIKSTKRSTGGRLAESLMRDIKQEASYQAGVTELLAKGMQR